MLYEVISVEIDISDSVTVSDIVDLGNRAIMGLLIPTLDSGDLTFQVAESATGTFRTLKNKSGTVHTITAGTGDLAIDSDDLKALAGYRFVKIVSATTQTSDRTFHFLLKG